MWSSRDSQPPADSVVLQNNGGDALEVKANGAFAFSKKTQLAGVKDEAGNAITAKTE